MEFYISAGKSYIQKGNSLNIFNCNGVCALEEIHGAMTKFNRDFRPPLGGEVGEAKGASLRK